jgi:hypothetical protein
MVVFVKMIEIRKAVKQLLVAGGINSGYIFYQRTNEDAITPYLILDISNSTDDGTLERFLMDIDGIDNKYDTRELETLMHLVDQALHRKKIYIKRGADELALTIYRENRLTFENEPEKRLFRRRYIYQLRTHEK